EGYTHIDTAIAYDNEAEIGKGLKAAQISRESLFITSKVPAEVKSYDGAARCIDESLGRLGIDYLDLMLIHAPKPWPQMYNPLIGRYLKENVEVFRAMMKAQEEGKIKSVGVSNFNEGDLKNIIDNLGVKPAANQIRTHIGHADEKTIEFCKENGILVEGYSPIMTGKLKNNKKVIAVAEKYGVSVAQICIRYDYQIGVLPLPKTTHREYLIQNKDVDFVIKDEDMEILKAIKTL
ncbi:MAG: aldo/keto reductase, partial [Clostridia bacterium]|nr:aldo/keto reductase [Clostridia bacterium]